jgi:lathosterol oxidase
MVFHVRWKFSCHPIISAGSDTRSSNRPLDNVVGKPVVVSETAQALEVRAGLGQHLAVTVDPSVGADMDSTIQSVFHGHVPGFGQIITTITADLVIRYTFLAGFAWLFWYVLFKRRWLHRKFIARFPPSSEVRREAAYSIASMLIFGVVGALTISASFWGWTRIYWRIADHGWGWFWASVVCLIFLHDAYFYWTHRLMHHRRLFNLFHRVHHLSHNPSPWAAYAFDPLEAVVQAGIFPLAAFVMPVHPLAFSLFMLWQIVHNVLGHAGYEIYPRWLMNTWFKRILNTPTNHVMHHEKIRCNYGIYFNLWDRLMRTNHADYERRFREVTAGKSGS